MTKHWEEMSKKERIEAEARRINALGCWQGRLSAICIAKHPEINEPSTSLVLKIAEAAIAKQKELAA